MALEPLFFACPARADGLLVLICDHTVVTHRQQAQVHGQGPALHDAPLQHIVIYNYLFLDLEAKTRRAMAAHHQACNAAANTQRRA